MGCSHGLRYLAMMTAAMVATPMPIAAKPKIDPRCAVAIVVPTIAAPKPHVGFLRARKSRGLIDAGAQRMDRG